MNNKGINFTSNNKKIKLLKNGLDSRGYKIKVHFNLSIRLKDNQNSIREIKNSVQLFCQNAILRMAKFTFVEEHETCEDCMDAYFSAAARRHELARITISQNSFPAPQSCIVTSLS